MKPLEECLSGEDKKIYNMLSDDLNCDIETLILLFARIGLNDCMDNISYDDFKVHVFNEWIRLNG